MVAVRSKVFRGDRLKAARERLDLTQDELAARLGFGQAQMNRYENGKSDPSLDVVMRLAHELQVTVDWLLGLSQETVDDFKFEELSPQEMKIVLAFRRADVETLMRTALEGTKPKEDDSTPPAKKK